MCEWWKFVRIKKEKVNEQHKERRSSLQGRLRDAVRSAGELRRTPVRTVYAAEAAAACCFGDGDSDSSQRTLTSFETPGSCMVTP